MVFKRGFSRCSVKIRLKTGKKELCNTLTAPYDNNNNSTNVVVTRADCAMTYDVILYFMTLVFCTPLHCTSLYYNVLHCAVWHCTVLQCTPPHWIALHCTTMYSTASNCTSLNYNVLHCTAWHLTVVQNAPQHWTTVQWNAVMLNVTWWMSTRYVTWMSTVEWGWGRLEIGSTVWQITAETVQNTWYRFWKSNVRLHSNIISVFKVLISWLLK